LINAMFGEEVAVTGTGTPVTQQTQLFESDATAVRIYDTKGFEIAGADTTAAEIKSLITQKNSGTNTDDMIGVIWYAVAANAGRIEPTEINFIKELAGTNVGVPVIVVLTKSDNRSEFVPLHDAIAAENMNVADIINVLATDAPLIHPVTGEQIGNTAAYGLEDLARKTYEVLPDLQKLAFANQQKADNELKAAQADKNRARAHVYIATAVTAAFAEGFVPIPLADSAMMIPTQMAMIAGITAAYNVELSKNAIATLVTTIAGTEAAALAGRAVASNLLKLIPGAGSVVGGVIAGGTGATITAALGLGYVALLELSRTKEWSEFGFEEFLGQINISEVMNSINTDEVKNLVKNVINSKK